MFHYYEILVEVDGAGGIRQKLSRDIKSARKSENFVVLCSNFKPLRPSHHAKLTTSLTYSLFYSVRM